MYIQTEETPNPNALKFLPGETVAKNGTMFVAKKEDAARSPMAKVLFEIPNVEAVFLGEDFVTITKSESARWEILKPMVLTEIMDFYITGKNAQEDGPAQEAYKQTADDNDPVVKQIKELIETRVRPAVAQDGGDIIFRDFRDGVVELELHGSCQGCPSSSATLKDGIENMLKHYVPEVKEVLAVA